MEPCPHCGRPLAIVPAVRLNAEARPNNYQGWQQPATFQSTAQSPISNLQADPAPPFGPAQGGLVPTYSQYERRAPARPATWESDFLVPLAQSAVWGIIGGVLSIGLPVFVNGWPWWTPLPAFVLSTSLAWWLISADHLRALWIVEKIINRDLDGDGQAGKPPPKPPVSMEVTHKTEAGAFVKMFRFDLHESITEALFQRWGREVLKNNDLTQALWVNRRRFIREAYTDMLDKLESAGLVQRAGSAKNAPYELTRAGRNTIRRYLLATHTHSLTHTDADFAPENQAGEG
jgi:hypothetical protein